MVFTLASFLMPPLLVFGLYHLLTWLNAFGINQRTYWRRIALASAFSHVLLVTGFLVFAYVDLRAHARLEGTDTALGPFLFNRSEFWRLMTIFDTASTLAILGLFWVLDRLQVNPPGLVVVTFAVI